MNLRGLSKLCCPICKSDLSIVAFCEERIDFPATEPVNSTRALAENDSIKRVVKEGVLLCNNCKVWFPVAAYIPVMLVFKTPFHDSFLKKHQAELSKVAAYSAPEWEAQPGERSIQETFTEEWDTLKDNELTFAYTRNELKALHKKVWLKWPEVTQANVHQILNVGCGYGTETEVLHEISNGAEVFGIDLNFSLLHSGSLFLNSPFVHLLIASLFHLPFREKFFDLVYSQGVLHHTYSTYEAFKSISAFVKEKGYLFIWVYALEDRFVKGTVSRLSYLVESIIRPILCRIPAILRHIVIYGLSVLVHILVLIRARHKKAWTLTNTNHHLRDLLTPRYAHRHSFNEVIEWFELLGFTYDLHSPATYKALFGKPLWGIGIIGQKISN